MTNIHEPTEADVAAGELFMERITKSGATKHDFIKVIAQARREGTETEREACAEIARQQQTKLERSAVLYADDSDAETRCKVRALTAKSIKEEILQRGNSND